MGFSAKQLQALKRNPHLSAIRTRLAGNRELSYIEGWYAITEANRIFGHDGWSRETLESKCVLARETRGHFLTVYLARVRVTVRARGLTVIREGHGTGEGRGPSPHEVHDIALKAAETDATKRALATFGRPFGLELYRTGKAVTSKSPPLAPAAAIPTLAPDNQVESRSGLHPDDTTPTPRPSRYYGLRSGPSMLDTIRRDQQPQPTAKTKGGVTPETPTAVGIAAKLPKLPQHRLLPRHQLHLTEAASTKASSRSGSPNAYETRHILSLSPPSRAWFAAVSLQIPIISALLSLEPSA